MAADLDHTLEIAKAAASMPTGTTECVCAKWDSMGITAKVITI